MKKIIPYNYKVFPKIVSALVAAVSAEAQYAYAGYPYAAGYAGYAGYPYAAGYAGYGYPYAAATGCRNYLGAAVPC